jgi:hypothetical protein
MEYENEDEGLGVEARTRNELNTNPSSAQVRNSLLLNGCQQTVLIAAVWPFVLAKSTKY